MRPVQSPPIPDNQRNTTDLWIELLKIGKDDVFRELEDNSYPILGEMEISRRRMAI